MRSPSVHIFGVEVNWSFKWAWNPGVLPFILVALLIIPLHKMKAEQVKAAWKETGQMVGGAAIALMFGIAMVQLFRNSGAQFNHSGMDSMLIVMANGMADLFGKAYIVVSPLIGVIGAFISGSATVSNTLFSNTAVCSSDSSWTAGYVNCGDAGYGRSHGQHGFVSTISFQHVQPVVQ